VDAVDIVTLDFILLNPPDLDAAHGDIATNL
jgi:hypothetical protein